MGGRNLDSENKNRIDVNPEEEIEEIIDEIIENGECRFFNFLVNCSNQANLVLTNDLRHNQVNVVLVLVHPYYINDIDLEEFNLRIKVDGDGQITVDDLRFEAHEIQPGIKVFGIVKNSGE